MWLARVTSLDQTSNCHLRSPRTPQCTRPLWIPTRMFTFTPRHLTHQPVDGTGTVSAQGTAAPVSTGDVPAPWNGHSPPQVAVAPGTGTTPQALPHSRDGLDHVDPHLHAAVRVVPARLRQPRHAVVAVPQDLDAQAVVLLGGGGGGTDTGRSGGALGPPAPLPASVPPLTAANLSKRAKSSLSVITSSWAVHCEARLVKPSMSAKRMLQGGRAWAGEGTHTAPDPVT